MNLSVVDYLVKPVDKVELGNLLEKIAGQLGERERKSQTLSQDLDEAGFVSYLGDKENWWIGLSKENKAPSPFPTMSWVKTGRFSFLTNPRWFSRYHL